MEQHKAANEGEKLTNRTIPSHPQNSFFSTLEWLDDTNSPQNTSQNITEPIQNNSQQRNDKQSSEHSLNLSSLVCACLYNLQKLYFFAHRNISPKSIA